MLFFFRPLAMALQYEPELEPDYTNLEGPPGRSRVENLVAWEEPGDARSKCVILELCGPHSNLQE